MPAPLVPAEIDLRGMPWMPLDTIRLIDSDLFALSTGDEFKAAVALWCKSWAQLPAASLPSDDRILAHLSGAGSRWKKVKTMALRGWIACDDGRLYHPVIAEKALEAWEQREEFQDRQDNEKTRLQQFRAEHKALRKMLREHGIVLPFDTKIDVLRERVASLPATPAETETETPPETPPETKTFQGGNACNAPAMAKTGTGTGTGTVKDQELPPTAGSEPPNERPAILNLESPPDPIFGTGLAFLRRKGVAEKPARSFLGLLRKEAGDLTCAELLAKAESDDVTEPLAWLRAAAKSRPKPSSHASHETPDFLVGAI